MARPPAIYAHGHPKEVCQPKLTDAWCASREDKSSLLDCAAPWFRIFLCMFGLIVVMAIGCGYALQL